MFTALEGFDFQLLASGEFKEDAVREEIISPILKELGYSAGGLNRIVRSRSLSHPFVKTGSGEREIRIVPDYLLLAANKPAWVLDAKAPRQHITSGPHVEQAFFYAIHPEIRSRYYALCNGREFAIFEKDKLGLALHFHVSEIERYWDALYALLAPRSFEPGAATASADTEQMSGGGGGRRDLLCQCQTSPANYRFAQANYEAPLWRSRILYQSSLECCSRIHQKLLSTG